MHDYIENKLIISGDSDQMEELLCEVQEKKSFEDLIPIPKGLDFEQELLWKMDFWGTKCFIFGNNDDEIEKLNFKVNRDINKQIQSIDIVFRTAFTPPLMYFVFFQTRYPKLKLHLEFEDESGIKGTASTVFENGISYFDFKDVFKDTKWFLEHQLRWTLHDFLSK